MRRLAAPEMAGRAAGEPGGELAARQIAGWLAVAGLTPGGEGGTFYQSLALPGGRRTDNVVALLRGTDPRLEREAVVVGAHYDHDGVVDGVLYPGADDNASGVAVVVGLARAFAATGGAPRTLVFVLFSAEERGLLGSRRYIETPPIPLDRTVAMLNFDMVGRLGAGRLDVGGAESGSGLRQLVAESARATGLRLVLRSTLWVPSDHLRFDRAGIPVLFFFTGVHADQHRPGDTADKIDADGLARIAALAAAVVQGLAAGSRPLHGLFLRRPAFLPAIGGLVLIGIACRLARRRRDDAPPERSAMALWAAAWVILCADLGTRPEAWLALADLLDEALPWAVFAFALTFPLALTVGGVLARHWDQLRWLPACVIGALVAWATTLILRDRAVNALLSNVDSAWLTPAPFILGFAAAALAWRTAAGRAADHESATERSEGAGPPPGTCTIQSGRIRTSLGAPPGTCGPRAPDTEPRPSEDDSATSRGESR